MVSICDSELASDALLILHNFFITDVLRYQVYEEAREVYIKSLELLYQGQADDCKAIYKTYLIEKVVNRTEDTDNSLKKYYKALMQKFKEDHPEVFVKSELEAILEQL